MGKCNDSRVTNPAPLTVYILEWKKYKLSVQINFDCQGRSKQSIHYFPKQERPETSRHKFLLIVNLDSIYIYIYIYIS